MIFIPFIALTPPLTPPQGEGDARALAVLLITKEATFKKLLSVIQAESPSPWGGVRGGVDQRIPFANLFLAPRQSFRHYFRLTI